MSLKSIFEPFGLRNQIKNQSMCLKVSYGVLFGCVISMVGQAQVVSKSGLRERKLGVSEGDARSVPTPTIQSARFGDHAGNVIDI